MKNLKLFFCIVFSLLANISFSQTTIIMNLDSTYQDAEVYNLSPNTNFGNSSEFNALAWTASGNFVLLRSFLKFKLDSIPRNAIISSAILSFYNDPNSSNNNGDHNNDNTTNGNKSYLFPVTQDWNENTITWNNQPKVSSQGKVEVPASTFSNQNYQINVTSIIQNMVSFPNYNFGISLQLWKEAKYNCLLFASSDHPNQSKKPQLTITYDIDSTINFFEILATPSTCEDAIVSSLPFEQNLNFGNSAEFNALAWTNASINVIHRGVIKFDYYSLPFTSFENCFLNLYSNTINSSNGGHEKVSGSNESTLNNVSFPWNENSITWINQPINSIDFSYLPESHAENDDYTFTNVASLVNDQINNSNNGFKLQLINEIEYRKLIFASSDCPDSISRPVLLFIYKNNSVGLNSNMTDGSSVILYPNPTNDHFSIIKNDQIIKSVQINNCFNQLIKEFSPLEISNNYYDLKSFSSGLYFAKIKTNNAIFTKKIIIR